MTELAFTSALRSHSPALYALARRYGLWHEDAQDAVGLTWCRVWQHRERYDGSGMGPWANAICRNACRDTIRANARRVRTCPLETEPLDRETPEDQLMLLDFSASIAAMRPKWAAVLRMSAEGNDDADIAEAVGTSPGTVRSRLFYARKELRARLSA